MSELEVAVIGACVVAAVLALCARLTGQVATRFGVEPRPWQLRMLPFGPFGPPLLWLLLSQRGGGRSGWA
jgi:hypothetical protein